MLLSLGVAGLAGFFVAYLIFMIIIIIALYVYSSLTLMIIAKRTNTEHAWFAQLPLLNVYLTAKIARKSAWPIILIFIPPALIYFSSNTILYYMSLTFSIFFSIFYFIWWWNICKVRGKPGWWILLTLIPFAGQIWALIMWGILAWGKDSQAVQTQQPAQQTPQQVNPSPQQ